jgi:hypothetical protein
LTRPECQLEISTPVGTFFADLGWEDVRLAVEFDGEVKYWSAGRTLTTRSHWSREFATRRHTQFQPRRMRVLRRRWGALRRG